METKQQLTARLVTAIQTLPTDKLSSVLDFVGYLQTQDTQRPERGSAAVILQSLDLVGPLEFESGELDMLLADIEQMRATDLEEHG